MPPWNQMTPQQQQMFLQMMQQRGMGGMQQSPFAGMQQAPMHGYNGQPMGMQNQANPLMGQPGQMSPQMLQLLQYYLQQHQGQGGAQMAGDVLPFKPSLLPGIQGGPGGTTLDLGGGTGMHIAPPLISPGQYNSMPDVAPSLQWLLRHGAANEANAGSSPGGRFPQGPGGPGGLPPVY